MTETATIATNHLYCGDCLELMRSWPDDVADLTVCSPPYEDARLYKPLEFTAAGQDWVDWMIPRIIEMCRVTNGLVLVNMAGKRRDWKYSPVVEWLVTDLTRHHGIVCGPAPYVFYRVGIPGSGSGKYHRRDWEPVYAFARPENCPPKWTDNTAMGHPPKWAPGGEMSNRLSTGARVNQWGHPIDSGATVVDDDGSVRSEGTRPSHKTVNGHSAVGRNKWGKNGSHGTRRADGTRDDRDKTEEMRLQRGNEKGSIAVEPVLADPGNVLQARYTAEEVVELFGQGDVFKALVGGGVMGDRLCHDNEAPYPERLPEFFIRSYCQPGGVVLDPFAGSATTCCVAKRSGRRWIGIDVRESQVGIGVERLARVQPELFQ